MHLNSTRRLSISIPETDISCDMTPPEILIAERKSSLENKTSPVNMECSPIGDHDVLGYDLDRNSNCDTASVASDLTRMCVSDEEDKLIVVSDKSENKTTKLS